MRISSFFLAGATLAALLAVVSWVNVTYEMLPDAVLASALARFTAPVLAIVAAAALVFGAFIRTTERPVYRRPTPPRG